MVKSSHLLKVLSNSKDRRSDKTPQKPIRTEIEISLQEQRPVADVDIKATYERLSLRPTIGLDLGLGRFTSNSAPAWTACFHSPQLWPLFFFGLPWYMAAVFTANKEERLA